MSENVRHTILRFALVFISIALLFVVVLFRVIKLQTVERDKWLGLVEKREDNQRTKRAIRGNIYDCEGRLLASSVPQYNIYMDTRVEALHMNGGELFWSHVDSIADGLSRIVGDQTKDEYRVRMITSYRSNKGKGALVRLSKERISYTQYRL